MEFYGISITVWVFAAIGAVMLLHSLADAAIKGWRTLGKVEPEPARMPEPLEDGEADRLAQHVMPTLTDRFALHHHEGPLAFAKWKAWAADGKLSRVDVLPVIACCDGCDGERMAHAILQRRTEGFRKPYALASVLVCRDCGDIETSAGSAFVNPRR